MAPKFIRYFVSVRMLFLNSQALQVFSGYENLEIEMASAKLGETAWVKYWRVAGSLSSQYLEGTDPYNYRLKNANFQ